MKEADLCHEATIQAERENVTCNTQVELKSGELKSETN